MGKFNHSPRHQKLYVQDFKEKEVFPVDCVPAEDNRPRGSWTKGVKAWKKGEQGESDSWIGWFHPPRFRKGKSLDRGSFTLLAQRNDSEE